MLGENDDLVMVDLEQQYWPYLWHPAWPPLAIWVHIILTLDKADTDRSSKTHDCTPIAGMQCIQAGMASAVTNQAVTNFMLFSCLVPSD